MNNKGLTNNDLADVISNEILNMPNLTTNRRDHMKQKVLETINEIYGLFQYGSSRLQLDKDPWKSFIESVDYLSNGMEGRLWVLPEPMPCATSGMYGWAGQTYAGAGIQKQATGGGWTSQNGAGEGWVTGAPPESQVICDQYSIRYSLTWHIFQHHSWKSSKDTQTFISQRLQKLVVGVIEMILELSVVT